jgi:hypothetical protein
LIEVEIKPKENLEHPVKVKTVISSMTNLFMKAFPHEVWEIIAGAVNRHLRQGYSAKNQPKPTSAAEMIRFYG